MSYLLALPGHQTAIKWGHSEDSPSGASKLIGLRNGQELRPLFNGRQNRGGLPITLYHPVFYEFQALLDTPLDDMPLPPQFMGQTAEFCALSAKIYAKEIHRQNALTELLSELLGITLTTIDARAAKADAVGIMQCGSCIENGYVAILELKNELGIGQCEVTVQGAQSYRKYTIVKVRCKQA